MRALYDVIGSNGPSYEAQRVIYSARLLRDARAVAQAVAAQGVDILGVHHTFQTVQVFRISRTLGRLVAAYGEAPWQVKSEKPGEGPEVSGRHPAGDAQAIRRGGR